MAKVNTQILLQSLIPSASAIYQLSMTLSYEEVGFRFWLDCITTHLGTLGRGIY